MEKKPIYGEKAFLNILNKMSSKKHILILPSWYKTKKHPVTGTFFEEQARMLQKQGHQVGVLFPSHNLRFLSIQRGLSEKAPAPFVDKGLPTYYAFSESIVPKYEYPSSLDIVMLQKAAYKAFENYKKKYGKPDILHAHSVLWGGIAANYISKKENIPYFLTKHFSGWILMEKMKLKSYSKLLQKTINDSKKTFVVSSSYKRQLVEHFNLDKTKLKVVFNIVNPVFFQNKSIIAPTLNIKIIVIGYLVEGKNHIKLFEAIQLLKQKGLVVELLVVGDGSYRDTLEDFVMHQRLSAEVKFLGLLDRQDVMDTIKEAHMLVSASTFETFGVNIIEAMAMGRPVVVYNSGGPEDIVRPQDGVLFNENSPEAFAKAIEHVIDNYESYDQMQIAEECMARFGEESIYKQLAKYYGKI